MKVSVITPTFARPAYLPGLVRIFKSQKYLDKELLILDDSPEPVPDAALLTNDDPPIRYLHIPQRLSVGEKRNRLVELAHGEVIVQFDDDDFYAPTYLDQGIQLLGQHDFFTFSGWYVFNVVDQGLYYWDTSAPMKQHFQLDPRKEIALVGGDGLKNPAFKHSTMWGFGFSYMFRRAVFPHVAFSPVNHGEDYDFVCKLQQAGFKGHTCPDVWGLVLHTIHPDSSTILVPQYRLPRFLITVIFGQEVLTYLPKRPRS